MSWGYKILLVYAVFVTGIMYMVFRSSNQKMDLVTTDYYEKELRYQEKIDEAMRAGTLSEPVRYEVKNNLLVVYFPKDFAGKKISGTVDLYCPADKARDVQKNFLLLDTRFEMLLAKTSKGQFELHITWQVDGVSYYFEKKLFL
jgi:hypothetical protein